MSSTPPPELDHLAGYHFPDTPITRPASPRGPYAGIPDLYTSTHGVFPANQLLPAPPSSPQNHDDAVIFNSKNFTQEFPEIPIDELTDGDQACNICFEAYGPEKARKLPCGHIFGDACLNEWLFPRVGVTNNSCPMCRAKVFDTECDGDEGDDVPELANDVYSESLMMGEQYNLQARSEPSHAPSQLPVGLTRAQAEHYAQASRSLLQSLTQVEHQYPVERFLEDSEAHLANHAQFHSGYDGFFGTGYPFGSDDPEAVRQREGHMERLRQLGGGYERQSSQHRRSNTMAQDGNGGPGGWAARLQRLEQRHTEHQAQRYPEPSAVMEAGLYNRGVIFTPQERAAMRQGFDERLAAFRESLRPQRSVALEALRAGRDFLRTSEYAPLTPINGGRRVDLFRQQEDVLQRQLEQVLNEARRQGLGVEELLGGFNYFANGWW